jgi:hypothetical protein
VYNDDRGKYTSSSIVSLTAHANGKYLKKNAVCE